MTEVFFYHLEARPLEQVVPQLLEKSLERGWRAVVEVGSTERAEALDACSGPIATTVSSPTALPARIPTRTSRFS